MKLKINAISYWLVLLAALSFFSKSYAYAAIESLRSLPVQEGGRIKPLETFARETLQLVHGKSKYKGRGAVEVVMTWMLIPDQWEQLPVIEIRHSGLREALKLDENEVQFSMMALLSNERVPLLFKELASFRETGEKLNPYFQEVQRLEQQLGIFHALRKGEGLHVAPHPDSDTWYTVAQLPEHLRASFGDVARAFVKTLPAQESKNEEELKAAEDNLNSAVHKFQEEARALAPEKYADLQKIKVEVHYNTFDPFQWAWMSYLIGVLLLVSHLVAKRKWQLLTGFLFIGIGFLLHTCGMALRSYISGRPPVTNMYETVVWVPWGCVLFAFILEKFQKTRVILISAALVAVFCLILTDLAPAVLDSSIQPLEPVLRSTFWLSTHVLIITISYAAFFLAFALGDLVLFYYLRDPKRYSSQIHKAVLSIYRAIQIGVVLLAAGTILGGVWADYSWGRFWGWDPKETWAFITLLGYLAILHARLVGWVRSFGMAAWSVLSFSLVIMAWYGVNFVLGAGLHSYGFGAGGVEYVSGFVALHILYVAFVSTVYRSRLKSSEG